MRTWRSSILLAISVPMMALATADAAVPYFRIQGQQFIRHDEPHVIVSGEMHYPRVPREYWRDRLRKARAMGLNTVQTYVFWNLHEPQPGRFDFSGNLDIAGFIRIAQQEGLDVIVRPGPYICTELDFGGFPAWLLRTPGIRVRSLDPRFLRASESYMKRVGQELAPLQSTRGGPIVMVQVENEYGSFGNDHDYMAAIEQQIRSAGFDVPLFTSDGPTRRMLEGGTLPGITPVINFAGPIQDAQEAFATLQEFRADVPRMVGEYWAGWFDHWGEQHHTTSLTQEAEAIDWMLGQGISVNLYMFHGGTNFGWLAGANSSATTPYQADTTSYDYDAPLDEAGRPTTKYFALREVIRKHLPKGARLPPVPASPPTIAIPRFTLSSAISLSDALPALGTSVSAKYPRAMEDLGQNYGFVLYRTTLKDDASGKLEVDEARDYAVVLGNGKIVGTLDRRFGQKEVPIALERGATLDLLIENMGRINFTEKLLGERKGITQSVSFNGKELTDWQMWSLPLSDLSRLAVQPAAAPPQGPAFWRGSFELDKVGGTYLDMREWGKGHAWVNGHHLGRYWRIGPQQALYVPGPWLRKGRNEVVVFDTEAGGARSLLGVTDAIYETPGVVTPQKPGG